MRRIIFFFVVIFSYSNFYAQSQRSDNLVVIGGQKYYLHKVQPKQTMYSISKSYMVSISRILELNHKGTTDLKDGELLKIPYAEPTTVIQSLKYKHYIVKKGDTLFSLAKDFGVSQEELITLNAGIEVALVEGRRLIVPIVSENQPRYDNEYYYHIVQPKETLSSIGRRYGIGLGKLKKINKDIDPDRLKPNGEVKIPIKNARAEIAAVRVINRKTKDQREVLVEKDPCEKHRGPLTKVPEGWKPEPVDDIAIDDKGDLTYQIEESTGYEIDFRDNYEMVILLPLKNSFVGMKNYYKGMLLAIQENDDIPATIHVYDSRRSRKVVKARLRQHKNADFIIGPYSQNIFPEVLEFANQNTTVVSLLSKNEAVYTNENVLQLNTTENTINHRIAEYVVNNHLNNKIVYFNGSSFVNYQDTTMLSSVKVENLANLISKAQLKNGKIKENYKDDLEELIDTSKKNIVIVPESDYKVVNQVLNALNVFSMHDVEVVGYYKWKLLPNIDPEMLFNLNVTYFTPFHFLSNERETFVNAYKERFQSFPDDFSYIGYETMTKLLKGIKTGGRNFYKKPLQKIQKHLNGGYENIDLYKIQFSQDFKIIAN